MLDIDRDRQRISLGLKQTQNDPWQQVLESYDEGDVVEGRVTKVVTFGAFVEILPGVEGLVHISELAQHHVENPREVVSQGQAVNVKIIEVDGERRRLSLSLKRVEPDDPVQPRADGGESVHLHAEPRPLRRRSSADEAEPATAPDDASRCRRRPIAEAAAEAVGGRRGRAEAVTRLAEPRRRGRGCREAEPSCGRGRGCAEPRRRRPSRLAEAEPRRGRRRPQTAGSDDADGATPSRDRRSPSRSPAASGPGRARRWRRSRATAPRRSRATRSSTSCCAATRSRRRSSSGSATASSRPTASSTAARSATVVFNDRDALAWLEALLHPLVVGASTSQWREQLAELPDAPRVCVTEVPLLYEVGWRDAASTRSSWSRRPTTLRRGALGRRRSTSASSACSPTSEKIARADYAYVNNGSLEELDAFVGSVMEELTREARRRRRSSSLVVVARRRGALRRRRRARRGSSASATRSTTRRSCASTRARTTSTRRCSRP